MKKMVGYILAAIGLIAFALSYPGVRTAFKIALPADITEIYLMISGIILLIIGAYIAFKGGSEKHKEVPIHHGEKIVGYRRIEE